jgi:hypothetical protein
MKSPNKAEGPAAKAAEEKGLAKGNSLERNVRRTRSRGSALERVRQAAGKDRKKRFTGLFLVLRVASESIRGAVCILRYNRLEKPHDKKFMILEPRKCVA